MSDNSEDIIVNYDSFIDRTEEYSENASVMLMRILQKIGITSYYVAGFDGFSEKGSYFNAQDFSEERFRPRYAEINKGISLQLSRFADSLDRHDCIRFITPSIYSKIFER